MYQTNLQTITGQSPEKRINSFQSTVHRNKFNSAKKGSGSLISAFMVLTLLFFISGCDNEGIVGEGLESGGERIETSSFDVTSLEILNDNGFSGGLSNTAIGIVEDPAYGTVASSALLKPSIDRSELDSFADDFTFKLKLEFNPLKYGEENSISDYNIYEVNERWRGREITYNDPVSFDESTIIGSFQVTDESSVEIELDDQWVDKYREFFNDDSAQSDSLFRLEFPGIAVVAENGNRKIDFLRHTPAEEDTAGTNITRFLVENEEDSLLATIPLFDHGTSMERTEAPAVSDDIVLHNTFENILKLDMEADPSEFEGKEIVNAQLIFTVKPVPAPTGFTRPTTELLRAHFFRSEPADIASEIFVSTPLVGATLSDEDQSQFKVNVTEYFIDKLFGDIETTPLFFTNQGNNGLYFSTTFYGPEAPEELRPRLIITTINPEN